MKTKQELTRLQQRCVNNLESIDQFIKLNCLILILSPPQDTSLCSTCVLSASKGCVFDLGEITYDFALYCEINKIFVIDLVQVFKKL